MNHASQKPIKPFITKGVIARYFRYALIAIMGLSGLCYSAAVQYSSEQRGRPLTTSPERYATHSASADVLTTTTYSVKYIDSVYDARRTIRSADVPIVFKNGILFTYLAARGERGERMKADEALYVSGSFVNWRVNVRFRKNTAGLYTAFIALNLPAGTYTYRFLKNGIWRNDSKQFYTERDVFAKPISAFTLTTPVEHYTMSPVQDGKGLFTFYLADNGYTNVYWMGTANVWNARKDPMVLKNGFWRIQKYLRRDEPYYSFLIDGALSLDPLNIYVAYSSFREEVSIVPAADYFLMAP